MNKPFSIILSSFIISLAYVIYAEASIKIDMDIIYFIESSNNPLAYNKRSKARGLGQITPIVLEEYNNFHNLKFESEDLFDEIINKKISDWYMNTRIPSMIKHFKKKDNIQNRLIAYNAGINYVKTGEDIPVETANYIEKYFNLIEQRG